MLITSGPLEMLVSSGSHGIFTVIYMAPEHADPDDHIQGEEGREEDVAHQEDSISRVVKL